MNTTAHSLSISLPHPLTQHLLCLSDQRKITFQLSQQSIDRRAFSFDNRWHDHDHDLYLLFLFDEEWKQAFKERPG